MNLSSRWDRPKNQARNRSRRRRGQAPCPQTPPPPHPLSASIGRHRRRCGGGGRRPRRRLSCLPASEARVTHATPRPQRNIDGQGGPPLWAVDTLHWAVKDLRRGERGEEE
ncbi:hypothetical protein LY76DRAFT_595639 [Colletotrichum caudatum]|nr:hypothetical protein LY76DRAFT_595639 [Colletotrichum caudatum]